MLRIEITKKELEAFKQSSKLITTISGLLNYPGVSEDGTMPITLHNVEYTPTNNEKFSKDGAWLAISNYSLQSLEEGPALFTFDFNGTLFQGTLNLKESN